jgi:hypothetical protein
VRLLAVTDEPWPVIERFFAERPAEAVVRDASGQGATAWRVSALPDTYVLDGEGRVRARVGGPRDWSTSSARAFLREVQER